MHKIWYVYRIIFSDGCFYIGYRGSKSPEEDFLIKYFSSSNTVKERIKNGENYTGEILLRFVDQAEAYETEQLTILEHFTNPLILNRSCYYKRKGFGILTQEAKNKISETSKSNWQNPKFIEKMNKRKRWTEESKQIQSERLTGVKRPDHSKVLKSKNTKLPPDHPFLAKTKTEDHKRKISISHIGKIKSEEHIKNLVLSKLKYKGKFKDHLEEVYDNPIDFLQKYNLRNTFIEDLDVCIVSIITFKKLGLEKSKLTKRQLGFDYLLESK